MQPGFLFQLALALTLAIPAAAVQPPAPHGATPTPAQVRHAERAFYAFCHFTVDTCTDREWGTGGESEQTFNPTAFDANQIVTTLNLNVPPDNCGLIHENDVESLRQLGKHLRQPLSNNLGRDAALEASNTRGRSPAFAADKLLDDQLWRAWITDDQVTTPEVALALPATKTLAGIEPEVSRCFANAADSAGFPAIHCFGNIQP